MKPICRVCGNSYVGTSVFGTYVCNSCDTRLEAEVARLTTERNDAQTNGVTTANYWMDRAEQAEAERDALRKILHLAFHERGCPAALKE